ncbi:MAG: imelysin family protein [Chloroflexota bacterium]
MKRIYLLSILLLVAVFSVAACIAPAAEAPAEEMASEEMAPAAEEVAEEAQAEEASEDIAEGDYMAALKQTALTTYADIAYASYEDSHMLAVELQAALEALVADPSEETHQAAKNAWLASNEPYGQTEAYRFYGGPIDDEDGPEGLLNAWPLDEAYVDYVDGAPEAGIINNVEEYPEISRELIASLNEVGAEENISTGYHAIEFLLWGQDMYEDSAGQRAYTDYVDAPNAERRGQYLLAVGEQLVDNLAEMVAAWDAAGADNYRAEFLASDADMAIQNVLTGLGVLSKSELAGERMFTALDNQDQEDEHSCFSDNTHRDIITNNQGVMNVYMGSYTRLDGSEVSGTSLADVVAAVDTDLNDQMVALLEASMSQVNAIHVPFDQAIVLADQRPIVLEAVMTLQDQGDKVAEVASALGLTVNTALPE